MPFFVSFLCFFSSLSSFGYFRSPLASLAIFLDTLYVSQLRCVSHVPSIAIQMCFVYLNILSRSRYVSSISIFFRDAVMFCQLWWGYRYVLSVAIFFLDIDMFCLSQLIFFCDPVMICLSQWGYRYVLSVAMFFLGLDMICLSRSWSFRGLLDWSEFFVVFSVDSW